MLRYSHVQQRKGLDYRLSRFASVKTAIHSILINKCVSFPSPRPISIPRNIGKIYPSRISEDLCRGRGWWRYVDDENDDAVNEKEKGSALNKETAISCMSVDVLHHQMSYHTTCARFSKLKCSMEETFELRARGNILSSFFHLSIFPLFLRFSYHFKLECSSFCTVGSMLF